MSPMSNDFLTNAILFVAAFGKNSEKIRSLLNVNDVHLLDTFLPDILVCFIQLMTKDSCSLS